MDCLIPRNNTTVCNLNSFTCMLEFFLLILAFAHVSTGVSLTSRVSWSRISFLMNCFYGNLVYFELFIKFCKTPFVESRQREKMCIGVSSCSEGLFTCLELLLDHHYLLCMSCVEIIRKNKKYSIYLLKRRKCIIVRSLNSGIFLCK